MASPETSRRTAPFEAFRSTDFCLFAASRVLASVAVQMQSVAVGYQLYALTHRAVVLGYVGLAQFLPVFLLSLPAGHAADRFDRRRVMLVCGLVYAIGGAALFTLTREGLASATAVYAVLVTFGAARAFYGPAASALFPSIVAGDGAAGGKPVSFANAAAWNSTLWQLASIGGPSLGGVLYGYFGSAGPVYATSSALYVVAALLILFVKAGGKPAAEKTLGASLETVFAGVRYVLRAKVLLGSISLDFAAVFLGGATALLPIFATDVLHVGPTGFGLLRAAPAVGAGGMAIALAFFPIERRAGAKMLACVGLFGAATIVFAISRSFTLSLCALGVLGAADMVSVVVRMTLEQAATPPGMRGRVGAVNMLFIGASNELGEFESGIAAAWLGVIQSVVAGGVGTLLVVALWALFFPALRDVDRAEAVQPIDDAEPATDAPG